MRSPTSPVGWKIWHIQHRVAEKIMRVARRVAPDGSVLKEELILCDTRYLERVYSERKRPYEL